MKTPIIKYAPEGDDRLTSWRYLEEAKTIAKYINDGDVIFDVGANICDHSIFFGLNFPNSKIIAFEPIKSFCEMAEKNIKENGLSNIEVMNYGLGDKEDVLNISVSNEASSIVTDHNSHFEKIKVEVGDRQEKLQKVDVLKIDVEGFEFEVLEGMKSIISKNLPKVILEVHPQFVGSYRSMQAIMFLKNLGYVTTDYLNVSEFVMIHGGKAKINRKIQIKWLKFARYDFDHAKTKEERNNALQVYKMNSYFFKPLYTWMIWSKLFVFFTHKKLK